MASEDSDELVPGFPTIHRLHHFYDLRQTRVGLMAAFRHQLDARSELLEIEPLGSTKRMLPEERDDPFEQIRALADAVAVEVFPVVVAPPVHIHLARTKELLEVVETPDAAGALRHDEVMGDLVSGHVATPTRPAWLPNEPDREASFSVYETDHPTTKLDQPFLLVFRTRHVVTMVNALSDVNEVVRDTPGFPAYSQMRTAPLLVRGAANSLGGLTILFGHVTLGRL
jgi:hypothetical protein